MFRCPITKKVSAPGERAYRVVLETRPKTYFGKVRVKNPETKKTDLVEQQIGQGFETVKEIFVSYEGLKHFGKNKE